MDVALATGDFGELKLADNQPFQIDELPSPALHHLFKYLDYNDQSHMRQLCKGMRRFIEQEYGIHAFLPARYSYDYQNSTLHPGRLSPILISDASITQAISSLEGRVIRSLEMIELHPDYIPFPFYNLIQYPWGLMRVSLKYVDVGFLVTLLRSCRNLSEFHYATGVLRALPEGTIPPVPTPMEGEQLIEFLTPRPQPIFQVDKLSSLSLRLEKVESYRHSDWANVAFLLLSLSQRTLGSLRNFKFEFAPGPNLILKERLQILACVGQFLSQCPNLRKLEYSDEVWSGWNGCNLGWDNDRVLTLLRSPREQNVLSCLVRKFGSAQLKETQGEEALDFKERMLRPIREMMRDAGKTFKNLRDVRFKWCCQVEHELFQILLSALPSPSIGKLDICDQTRRSFTDGSYNLFLGQIQQELAHQLYGNLEKLCISRARDECREVNIDEDNRNERISLPRLLDTMRALTHFEFEPRNPYRIFHGRYGPELQYRVHQNRRDFETPDVTFEEVADVHFQQLQVLRLEGVKMSTQATGRLILLRNLKELTLKVFPEHRHQLFGIKSEDLIRLMGTLRKLERLSVNMIQFPDEDHLKLVRGALQGVGNLCQMRRVQYSLCSGTQLMAQYKFTFGSDDPEDID